MAHCISQRVDLFLSPCVTQVSLPPRLKALPFFLNLMIVYLLYADTIQLFISVKFLRNQ